MKPMSTDRTTAHLHAARRMQAYGGSFAAAIAEAWFLADSHNRKSLEAAFAPLFARYMTEYLTESNHETSTH
jgi:hypothetical protein